MSEELKAGWHFAKHRLWKSYKDVWMLVYVTGKKGWRGQTCHCILPVTKTTHYGEVETTQVMNNLMTTDFEDFVPVPDADTLKQMAESDPDAGKEFCDECGVEYPENADSLFGRFHAGNCSLHPDNMAK
jgi:hypothetical protein